jgi:ABC-type multidrug transport system fused ATPase/permease subunit
MDAINSLHGRVTLIIVAHRLSTIERCDYIYEIKDGGVTLREGRTE